MKASGGRRQNAVSLWHLFFADACSFACQQFPTKPSIYISEWPGGARTLRARRSCGAEKHLGQPLSSQIKGEPGISRVRPHCKREAGRYHLVGTSTAGLLYVPTCEKLPIRLMILSLS